MSLSFPWARSSPWHHRFTPELAAILLVYFVQGALGIARLATSFYFKDQLGLAPAEVAALTGIAVIPWTIKPLYGFISDNLPIAGYRRRPYLLLSGLAGCAAWWSLATVVHSAWAATVAVTLSSLSIAIADVIVDAIVVERTRAEDRAGAGTLQSLTWGATAVGSLVTAYWSGALLERFSPQVVFEIAAALPILVAIAAWVIGDKPAARLRTDDSTPAPSRFQQLRALRKAIAQPSIFLPAGFMFCWQATPSTDSAFFFFVTNDLGFGPEFLGRVRLLTSIASLLGIFIFQRWLRAVPLRKILFWMTLISFVLGLTSLILVLHLNRAWGVDDRWFSLGDSVVLTVAGQIAFMPILVLAARMCPPGIEATLFALLMSVLNLAGLVSQELGAILTHSLGVTETDFTQMWLLVALANATTLLPLPLLRWLPDTAAVEAEPEGRAGLDEPELPSLLELSSTEAEVTRAASATDSTAVAIESD
ncbi:MAG: folate/biopterin family MFS transporter [Cyanobacteria bacterium J06642_2]